MMQQSEARFEVDGRGYRIKLRKDGDNVALRVDPDAKEEETTLGSVVSSFWTSHAEDLLESIQARTGMSLEGDVSFAYHEEYPDEVPPGVTVSEFGRSSTISESTFARYVAEYGLAYMKAASEIGLPPNESLRPKLLALRARPSEPRP